GILRFATVPPLGRAVVLRRLDRDRRPVLLDGAARGARVGCAPPLGTGARVPRRAGRGHHAGVVAGPRSRRGGGTAGGGGVRGRGRGRLGAALGRGGGQAARGSGRAAPAARLRRP